jgi:hypothetical protein
VLGEAMRFVFDWGRKAYSHLPIRRRERQMQLFKSQSSAQRSRTIHAGRPLWAIARIGVRRHILGGQGREQVDFQRILLGAPFHPPSQHDMRAPTMIAPRARSLVGLGAFSARAERPVPTTSGSR